MARPGDPDLPPLEHRLLRAISQRIQQRGQLAVARQRATGDPPPDISATSQSPRRGGPAVSDSDIQPAWSGVWEIDAAAPLLLRPEQVARLLNVGRSKVFDLIRSGELRSVKSGGSRRISATALREYVDRLEAEEAA
jgi:excisionase family DNA binding protein